MHIFRRNLGLISALSIIAFAGGCTGFFVNPTLSSIAVGPTATIQTTKTVQMGATGTFSDGSTKTNISGLIWNSGDPTIATVNSSGLVTGVSPGTATITAAVGSVSGSATITVTVGNITSITVQTNPQGIGSVKAGNQQQFKALATTSTGETNVDVTNSVTWAVQSTTVTGASITNGSGGGLLTTTSSGGTGTVTVTATDPTSGNSGQLNITVN